VAVATCSKGTTDPIGSLIEIFSSRNKIDILTLLMSPNKEIKSVVDAVEEGGRIRERALLPS
jgi:hypothetical protein